MSNENKVQKLKKTCITELVKFTLIGYLILLI